MAGVIGMGPVRARQATERVLSTGSFDHVMVVGIAGGLDPALCVGALIVPRQVRLHPDGPLYDAHPLSSRAAEGRLMTTDGLISQEKEWRPILESGFGAIDMEAAGVAEACERAGIDWSIYRGISDRLDQNAVDHAVVALSKPDGSPDLVAVGKYLARDLGRVKVLIRLKRAMEHAAEVAATAALSDLRRG
jgi:nucleoside phosphorylase